MNLLHLNKYISLIAFFHLFVITSLLGQFGLNVGNISGIGTPYVGDLSGIGNGSLPSQDCSFICEDVITSNQIAENNLNELEVFPNPSSSMVSFFFNGLANKPACVSLMSIQGREVMRKQLEKPLNQVHQFNISKSINPGVYILQVQQGESIFSERLIITH